MQFITCPRVFESLIGYVDYHMYIYIYVSVRSRSLELCQEGRTSGERCSSLKVLPATPAANQSRTHQSALLPTQAQPQTAVHALAPDVSHCGRNLNFLQVCVDVDVCGCVFQICAQNSELIGCVVCNVQCFFIVHFLDLHSLTVFLFVCYHVGLKEFFFSFFS